MGLFKSVFIVVALIAVILGAFVLRIKWANSTPSLPKGMPQTAIWLPAPPAPLDFSPRGYWLACWLDHNRNVDRCKLTDYKGNLEFDEEYSPVAGPNPIPDDRLHLIRNGDINLWAWSKQDNRGVPIVHLEDGTVLVPTQDLTELRSRYAPNRHP